jgi:hypothetical protein
MKTQLRRTIFAAGLITATLVGGANGQQDEKLGKVAFPTSCDPKVQAEFDRGVAMLHSYWFLIARRTFEGVLRQDRHNPTWWQRSILTSAALIGSPL